MKLKNNYVKLRICQNNDDYHGGILLKLIPEISLFNWRYTMEDNMYSEWEEYNSCGVNIYLLFFVIKLSVRTTKMK